MRAALRIVTAACLMSGFAGSTGCQAPFPSNDYIYMAEAVKVSGRTESELRTAVMARKIRAFARGPLKGEVTEGLAAGYIVMSRTDLDAYLLGGSAAAAPGAGSTAPPAGGGAGLGPDPFAPGGKSSETTKAEPTATAPPAGGAAPQPRAYALLVGVRKYDPNELRELSYSETDVAGLAKALRGAGWSAENITLLTQTRGADEPRYAPTAENIRRELKLILADRGKDDAVTIAFAGHGVQYRNSDESWFCPSDARLADRKSLISLTELYKEMAQCAAGTKLLLVDACRNEPQTDNSRSRAEVEVGYFTRAQEREPPAGVTAFFSCASGEKAFEHSKLAHGVFFHFVIEGLQGPAARPGADRLTVADLEDFVGRRVNDFVKREYSLRQTPALVGQGARTTPLVVWKK